MSGETLTTALCTHLHISESVGLRSRALTLALFTYLNAPGSLEWKSEILIKALIPLDQQG